MVTAAAGQMNSCAVIHDAASLSAGSVISTVTVKTALMRQTAVCLCSLLSAATTAAAAAAAAAATTTTTTTTTIHFC